MNFRPPIGILVVGITGIRFFRKPSPNGMPFFKNRPSLFIGTMNIEKHVSNFVAIDYPADLALIMGVRGVSSEKKERRTDVVYMAQLALG